MFKYREGSCYNLAGEGLQLPVTLWGEESIPQMSGNGTPNSLVQPEKIHSDFSPSRRIVLHRGDTLEFLGTVPSNKIKLIICSPPYNLGKQYETAVDLKTYLQVQEAVIDELVKVLHEEGSLCWQVGNYVLKGEVYPLDIFYYDLFKKRGLKLRNRIIWHFEHGLHASRRFSGRYETLLWFTKGDRYTFNLDAVRVPSKYPGKRHYKGPKRGKLSGNPLGKNPSDFWNALEAEWQTGIWNIPNVKANHPEKTIHPCQFPVELVERCVLALTNPADWVLDPYAGVGSTLIAGIRRNRKVAGCDKEAAYVQMAKQRIADFYRGKLNIRPIGKPVHQPSGREKISKIPEGWRAHSSFSPHQEALFAKMDA